MAVSQWADPYVGPRWRNGQGADAPPFLGIADSLAVGVKVAKAFARALAHNAGPVVADVAQAGFAGGCDGIGDDAEFAAMGGLLEGARFTSAAMVI